MYKQPTHRYTISFKSNYYRVTYLRGYTISRIVKNYALNRIYNEKLSRMLSKWCSKTRQSYHFKDKYF